MLNPSTGSFTELGCPSFRPTDSIYLAYQERKVAVNSVMDFILFSGKARNCSRHWGYSAESDKLPALHVLEWEFVSSLGWNSSMGEAQRAGTSISQL